MTIRTADGAALIDTGTGEAEETGDEGREAKQDRLSWWRKWELLCERW
jgi:hypothetical protein